MALFLGFHFFLSFLDHVPPFLSLFYPFIFVDWIVSAMDVLDLAQQFGSMRVKMSSEEWQQDLVWLTGGITIVMVADTQGP